MVNVQKYLDQNYPKESRSKITNLNVCDKGLEGHLDLSDFTNLEKLDCSKNQLTSIDLSNCKNLQSISCYDNQLTSTDFLKELPNPDNISYLSITMLSSSLPVELKKLDKYREELEKARTLIEENYIQRINELKWNLMISPESLREGNNWESKLKSKENITEVEKYAKEVLRDIYQKAKREIPVDLWKKVAISEEERIENLVEVVKNNDIKELRKLVQEGASDIINKKDKQENVPLHYAVINGNEEIVRILLEIEGIDVNVQNRVKLTPFHLSVRLLGSKNKEEYYKNIFKLFLNKEVETLLGDENGYTVFHYIAEKNDWEVFESFIKKVKERNSEFNVNNVKNKFDWPVINSVASGIVEKEEDDWRIMKFLLQEWKSKVDNELSIEEIFTVEELLEEKSWECVEIYREIVREIVKDEKEEWKKERKFEDNTYMIEISKVNK